MGFQFINLETITEKELIEILDENHKTAIFLESEIKKLEEVAKKETSTIKIKPSLSIKEHQTIKQVDEDDDEISFEDEINYYLENLQKLNLTELDTELPEILPVRKNYNYTKIIHRLRLETIKNIKELKEILESEKETLNLEDVKEYKEELELERNKLSALTEKLSEPVIEVEEKQNTLIFVKKSGGNIRVLEEINHIPQEYYEGFLGLFNSIKDGTFKNVKRYASSNNTSSGICAVKDFKIRVVFDKLDKNTYAIISAFTKKTDYNNGYLKSQQVKIAEYRKIADELKEKIKNEEFIQEHKEYEEQLFSKLNSSKKIKKKVELK